jgi:hypothetical protein
MTRRLQLRIDLTAAPIYYDVPGTCSPHHLAALEQNLSNSTYPADSATAGLCVIHQADHLEVVVVVDVDVDVAAA